MNGFKNVLPVCNGIVFSHKKEIPLFAITWVGLKGIMLSEITQTKINTVQSHLYVESKKTN